MSASSITAVAVVGRHELVQALASVLSQRSAHGRRAMAKTSAMRSSQGLCRIRPARLRRETRYARVRLRAVLHKYPLLSPSTRDTTAWLSTKFFSPFFRPRQVKASIRARPDHGENHVGAVLRFVSAAEETPAESPNHGHRGALGLYDGTETSSSSCTLRVAYSRALVVYGDTGTTALSRPPRMYR